MNIFPILLHFLVTPVLSTATVSSSKDPWNGKRDSVVINSKTRDFRRRRRVVPVEDESSIPSAEGMDGEKTGAEEHLVESGTVGSMPARNWSSIVNSRNFEKGYASLLADKSGKHDKLIGRIEELHKKPQLLWKNERRKLGYSKASLGFERLLDEENSIIEMEYSLSMIMSMGGDFDGDGDVDGDEPGDETIPPSQCKDMSPDDAINRAISQITPSELLIDPTTPQRMAYTFVTEHGGGHVDPCSVPSSLLQRYALVVFFYSTNGDNWDSNTGWLTEAGECSWFGIFCSPGDGTVTEIFLPENGLSGVIPNEISAFASLEYFDIFGNSIQGEIPSALSAVTNIEVFDVERNLLEGPPVVNLRGLHKLKSYRVSFNLLSGSISSEIGDVTSLAEVWMAGNSITGRIPEAISSMANLETLFLYRNLLTGPLPSMIGSGNLVELQLHENHLTGPIPSSIFGNIGLQYLQLDSNALTGEISQSIGSLTNLVDFRVNSNGFRGSLPASLMGLHQLVTLRVNENQLTGTIRDSFELWDKLDYADFADNMFVGSLPSSIFGAPAVRLLYFSNNNFDGVIPEAFGNTPLLEDLFIDGNSISGTVPELQAGQLLNLGEFLLFDNQITGTMSSSVCQLRISGKLDDLWADCGVNATPAMECDCCNQCFPEL